MERKSPETVINDAKGVQVGDGNVQNNYYNTVQVEPKSTFSHIPEIDPVLAIAHYDRVEIFPTLAAEFSLHKVSTIFLMGGKQDWHSGIWDRLKNHLDFRLNEKSIYANVTWSHSKNIQQRAMFGCWDQTVKGFSKPSNGSLEQVQQDITKHLLSLSIKQPHFRVVVKYDIRDLDWNSTNLEHLESLVNDWKRLHQSLKVNSPNPVSIGLVFCVVEEADNLYSKILRLWGKGPDSHKEQDFETYTQLSKDYSKAFFSALPLVTEDEIDEWKEALQVDLAEGIRDAEWWNNVKLEMKNQLEQYKSAVEHKRLRDDLMKNEKFKQAWSGKID